VQEDAARSRQVLGDDGVEQPRRDAALDDDPAEARRGSRLSVVVERVAVAGQLGEELDVTSADLPRPGGPLPHFSRRHRARLRAFAPALGRSDSMGQSRSKEPPMASRLNPYISFPGTARDAMEFYKDVFGGNLAMNTFAEFGADAPNPDQIMHSQLETDRGFTLMASDLPPGMEHQPGNDIAVSLSGDDAAELRGYWDKLSDGGTVTMPLERQMWGDEFGMCVDRFGVSWMLNIGQPQA
jgi:PhnB protein